MTILLGGALYNDDGALNTSTAAVDADSVLLGGWAHTQTGAAHIVDAESAVPATAVFIGGAAFTAAGERYIA